MAALTGEWSEISQKAAAAVTQSRAAASASQISAVSLRTCRACSGAANVELLPVEVLQDSCSGLF
eukprot:7736761-Pyramimonas_sp.AAC.1